MKRLPDILIALAAMLVLLASGGCSMTPREEFAFNVKVYRGERVAYKLGVATGKLVPPAKDEAKRAILSLHERLVEAKAWIAANPALADVPGIRIPSLNLIDRALGVVGEMVPDVLTDDGLPEAPVLDVPATQPGRE